MLEYDELKVEFEGYEPELKELAGALDLDNCLLYTSPSPRD